VQENLAELEAVCSALDISPITKIMKMNTRKDPLLYRKKNVEEYPTLFERN
jgi:hypothetical protein